MYSLGIDLGTNSVKSLLLDLENGNVLGISQKSYGYITGTSAEQDTDYVFQMVVQSIREVISEAGIKPSLIKCIGLSGQMHGTVLYDRSGKCISNIITWEDNRCDKAFLDEIVEIGGDEVNKSGCGIATGYLGPTLYHIIRNSNVEIGHALLPTDWLRQLLTGEKSFKTDHSNGSSTGFFDTQARNWNFSLIEKLRIDQDIFPKVEPTSAIDCVISRQISDITGLKPETPVIIGGGDQPLSMIGSGICDSSDGFLVNIGTGSQVSKVDDKYIKKENTIAFCFPEKGYSLLGAGLSGGASLNWWRNVSEGYTKMLEITLPKINVFKEMSRIASEIPAGCDGLAFIPYLSGTRVNPDLTASFIGLKRHHGYGHLTRAIMEGVMFELYHFYESLKITSDSLPIIGAGGGFSSELWAQIASDIFNKEIKLTVCQEQASLGAALLAGVAIGCYRNIKEACSMVKYRPETVKPNMENAKKYREIYENLYLKRFVS